MYKKKYVTPEDIKPKRTRYVATGMAALIVVVSAGFAIRLIGHGVQIIRPSTGETKGSQNSVDVFHTEKHFETTDQIMPYQTITIDDPSLPSGAEVTKVTGKNGTRRVTYEVTLQNGVEISRKAIQEEILQAPTDEVIAKGFHPPEDRFEE